MTGSAFSVSNGGVGAQTLLITKAASNSATLDFDNYLTGTYNTYLITFFNVVPVTSAVIFEMLIGTGAGPTYQTANYQGVAFTGYGSGATYGAATTGASYFALTYPTSILSNVSTNGASGYIYLYNVNDATNYKSINGMTTFFETSDTYMGVMMYGQQWQAATVLTSLRFKMSSGNISTGTVSLYGISS